MQQLIYVTHIDDSIVGLRGPYLYFWGITCDHNLLPPKEKYLKSLTLQLEISPPHLGGFVTISELKLSKKSIIEVLCIDSGVTYLAPLNSVEH